MRVSAHITLQAALFGEMVKDARCRRSRLCHFINGVKRLTILCTREDDA